jgi:multiple sugar transport system substrate-binding protein
MLLRGITWDHVRGYGGLRATADAYAAERPGVEVEWTVRSLQAFADQPVDDLARTFDLIYLDHPAIGYAVARECLVAFDEHLDPAALDDQTHGSVGRSAESYVWEGRRWALAADAAAQVAAYRPDLMDLAGLAVPSTWDDVLQACDALREAGLWTAMPCGPVDAFCAFVAACTALGDEPCAHASEGVVSRSTGRSALELMRAVIQRCHPSSPKWNPPAMLEHMSTEDDVAYAPLAFGYSNYARPRFRPHVVRAAGGPAGPGGVPRGTLGGAGLAVSARSASVDEAVRYAAFVARPDVQRTVYLEGGGQPGHRSAWEDDQVNAATSGFFSDTLDAMDAAYLRPRYDGFLRFQSEGGDLIHRHLVEGGDADDVLDRLDGAYRASLDAGISTSGAGRG